MTKVKRFFKLKQNTLFLWKLRNLNLNPHGISIWNDFAPVGIGIHFSEFGSKIQDYGRIINPNQDDDDGTRSAINGGNGGTSQIKSNGKFAKHKEKRSKTGTYQRIFPSNVAIGKRFENNRKQHGCCGKQDQYIKHIKQING